MPREKGDPMATSKGLTVGRNQVYAVLTDENHNPILDENNDVQVIEVEADAQGRLKTVTSLFGSNGEQVSVTNGKLDVNANVTVDNITTSSEVSIKDNKMELRGLAANKPAANTVTVGATYWSVDTDPQGVAKEVSNGTAWVATATNTVNSVADGTTEVTTPGTPVLLHADYPCRSVLVVAKETNTGVVYIGDGTPVMPFSAGKGVSLAVDNLNRVSIDAAVAGEGVYWLAEV